MRLALRLGERALHGLPELPRGGEMLGRRPLEVAGDTRVRGATTAGQPRLAIRCPLA